MAKTGPNQTSPTLVGYFWAFGLLILFHLYDLVQACTSQKKFPAGFVMCQEFCSQVLYPVPKPKTG
jgi:hypothetical protein